MEAPDSNKRPRKDAWAPSSSSGQIQNPNSLPTVPDFSQNHVDLIISSFFSLPDLPSLSSPLSTGCSFDRALDKLFEATSFDESAQDRLIDRGLQLTSILHESTERCSRKRATLRNSRSWSLPHELTIKVFSMLDTKSLMQASACCTMFNKCASDPLCYSHIDLKTGSVDSRIVRSMILQAGKELRSLKVGCPDKSTKCLLSRSCLAPLSYNHGFLGNLLRNLCIYNNGWLERKSLCDALSVCSNLTDLKIVGLGISLDKVLNFLTSKCQHLFIEKDNRNDETRSINVQSFGRNCPNITSLSLIGFSISDTKAYFLITVLRKLKYLNLSNASRINGNFLRDMRQYPKDIRLETLILRDCVELEERNICRFLDLLVRGHFRSVRHIDVSSSHGLVYSGGRSWKPKFPFEDLQDERPSLTLVAEFTSPSDSSSSSEASSWSSDSLSSSSEDLSSSSRGSEDDY